MPKIIETKLIDEFKSKGAFTREELFDFFQDFEPDLKEGTFGWRIYDLKKKDIIRPVRRGLYAISYKPKYKPILSSELFSLFKEMTGKYDDISYCVWETDWLNELTRHQTSKKMLIVEVEKELVESVYFYLKDRIKGDIFFNPDEKTIEYYVSESAFSVVVKKNISRSPTNKVLQGKIKINTPAIEKMLVDLYVDSKLFYFFQGSELKNIYENTISNFAVNFTKLLSYAKRRQKENEIKSFLTNNLSHLVKNIIDD